MKLMSSLVNIFFVFGFLLLTLQSQSQQTSVPHFQFQYTVEQVADTSATISIKGKILVTDINVFSFSEQTNGYSSQINSTSKDIKITSILHSAGNRSSYHIDGEEAPIYSNQQIEFTMRISFKSPTSLPEVLPFELLTLYQNKTELNNIISTLRISRTDILAFYKKTDAPVSELQKTWSSSLMFVFIFSFLGGLLALLTPCIYAMIPLTVSFFIKKSASPRQAKINGLIYALSIILIFAILGLIITSIFGPASLNLIATNSIANIIFFLIFFAFSLSFFGVFEISLPSSWSTQTGKLSGKIDIVGIFFMALTLVIVSFSCTGPIIGSLIVLATQGSYLAPLVGILGFSIALAIPFFLFSIFPFQLNKLFKSGSWLNRVKVVLGFIELALSLKFLSNADLALGTRLLDREVFLALWIVIFLLLGLYLIGAIRFKLDDVSKNDYGHPYLSTSNLLLTIASWGFVVYLLPGLWGAPLKAVSAFLPPMGTQDYRLSSNTNELPPSSNKQNPPSKYVEQMQHLEPDVVKQFQLSIYFDYGEALQVAKKDHKPLMLDFTGVNCVNCRKMEAEVWTDPNVARLLKDSFVIASLYVDVNNVYLNEDDIYINQQGEKMMTIGEKYAAFQIEKFSANVQPYYFFLSTDERRIVPEGYGYNGNATSFLQHLRKVLSLFHASS